VRVRALFTEHSDFSDITPTQYEAAYTWIRDIGLLDDLHSIVPAHRRVFDSAMAHSGAPWFPDADLLIQSPEELPDDVIRAAGALGLSEGEAFGQVGAVWGKVDTRERSRIGAAGELALVALLRESTQVEIEHVAAWSDGFGYDIAVHASQHSAHLEVKTTVRRRRLTVYISRNEYETMLRDPGWELVAIRLTPDLEPQAVATVPKEWIAQQAPSDQGGHGRWESCRLDVPSDVPVPGIPRLSPLLAENSSELLSGCTE
jgi:hypothetical protein